MFAPSAVFPASETIFSQQVSLPHVLPLREPLWDLNLAEVLNALFQLLLNCELLFCGPFLAAAGITGAGCKSAQQVTLASLFRLLDHGDRALFQRPVQGLDIGTGMRLATYWATDDCSLGRASL